MSSARTSFQAFLQQEIQKYRGVAVPLPTPFLKRLFTRTLPPEKLHPNPEDEFCDPEIGPNDQIIGNYIQTVTQSCGDVRIFEEKVLVERMQPDGYMILNGHHRWAAALWLHKPKIRVRIVNLTTERDVKKMLEKSTNEKRAALDLDEVVFCDNPDIPAEPFLPGALQKRYPERVMLGVPALFHYLSEKGYDIWVHTSKYDSATRLKALFMIRHAPVRGIITGQSASRRIATENLKEQISRKYAFTLYIDRNTVLRSSPGTRGFEEFPLSGGAETWSREVMQIVDKIQKKG